MIYDYAIRLKRKKEYKISYNMSLEEKYIELLDILRKAYESNIN